MALQKEQTYLVLNYGTSPVSITTRHGSELIEGGSRDNPSAIPLKIEEIITANSNGCAFKYGLLRFEKEYEEDIYTEIRLHDWRNILTDQDIEDILLCPTKEGLERILAIDNEIYFNRVVGVYYGLKSIFADISPKVDIIIEQRRAEMRQNKRKTEIVVSKVEKAQPAIDQQSEIEKVKAQNALLIAQMEELKKMLTTRAEPEIKPAASVEPSTPKAPKAGRPVKNS